jgi:urea transport system substrate-binding protein
MKIVRFFLFLVPVIVLIAMFFYVFHFYLDKREKIKVGVLFSETGTMANSEIPVINATLLAIDEINSQGGINGKLLSPVVYDGESNWNIYAAFAKKMILQDKVKVIFGCWTSACRKHVKPVVEKYNSLLIYPTQYEGTEQSRNIIYLGETPNQQILPALSWMTEHHGPKFFFVGSDYIYPHVANEIIAADIKSLNGTMLGTEYIPLGSTNVDNVINKIIAAHPDFIVNTINGDTNVAFFNRYYELTKNNSRAPVISFSLSTTEMAKIGFEKLKGDYAILSYFPSLNTDENKLFLEAYKKKYGSIEGINDSAVTAYAGVYLWAQAARQSPIIQPYAVREFMLRQSVASPAGVIYIDPVSAGAWRTIMIAKINQHAKFEIVWTSLSPIQPIIYMDSKTKAAWDLFEYQLYTQWGNSWENMN